MADQGCKYSLVLQSAVFEKTSLNPGLTSDANPVDCEIQL